MAEPILELQHAHRIYNPGPNEVRAMNDISLTINRGEFAAIVGPSGSGKSTVLNCIGCLDQPTRGKILLEGEDITQLSADQRATLRALRIGFVFQSFNLIPVLDAFENVAFSLELQGKHPPQEVQERTDRIIDLLGLSPQRNRRPAELSGGQQQRVAIARALVKEPAIVLADEPTANLDRKTSEDIIALMRRMNEELSATFVFSTHDEKLMAHAQRIIRIEDGRVVGGEEAA